MKRLLQASGVLSLCIFLAGCGSDSREGLISDTILMMNQAATEIGNIQKAVATAVKESEDKGAKLNLAAAVKAADKLKETGDKTLEIKARIEMVKAQITEAERKTYAENKQEDLNLAFKDLLAKKDALSKTLADAEKSSAPNARQAVEELRKKLVIAESPFEALTR